MLKFLCVAFAYFTFTGCYSQDNEKAVRDCNQLIPEAINNKDASLNDSVFAKPSALFFGTMNGVLVEPVSDNTHTAGGVSFFIEYWKKNKLDVQQEFDTVIVNKIENGIALVNTKYKAFKDTKLTHWGDEYYTLVKTKKGWKIISCAFVINTEN